MKTLNEMVLSGATRDEVIITLVTEQGYSLNKATKAYGHYAKEHGLTSSVVSHKGEALEYLNGAYPDGVDWDAMAVKAEVVILSEKYGVAESTARDYCKAFSKEIGVDHPMVDPRARVFDWFLEHDGAAEKEEFILYATEELGRSKSNANEYWKGYELHLYLS